MLPLIAVHNSETHSLKGFGGNCSGNDCRDVRVPEGCPMLRKPHTGVSGHELLIRTTGTHRDCTGVQGILILDYLGPFSKIMSGPRCQNHHLCAGILRGLQACFGHCPAWGRKGLGSRVYIDIPNTHNRMAACAQTKSVSGSIHDIWKILCYRASDLIEVFKSLIGTAILQLKAHSFIQGIGFRVF